MCELNACLKVKTEKQMFIPFRNLQFVHSHFFDTNKIPI